MATQTTIAGTSETPPAPNLERRDQYWVSPLSFVLLFSAFGVWVTFRAFQNEFYNTATAALGLNLQSHYLSPLYSPTISTGLHIGHFAVSPALFILPFPLCFRLSCYYYRKSIYRGYMLDPLGCAVTEPGPLEKSRFKKYTGERVFPFVVQNFHRFTFYAAACFVFMLWKDTFESFFFTVDGATRFGVGLVSIVFLINIVLLTTYTFSCHSWRHLIGGSTNCYSCSAMNKTRYGLWKQISFLNERHGTWAMASLVSVAVADIVVFLTTSGFLPDWHLIL